MNCNRFVCVCVSRLMKKKQSDRERHDKVTYFLDIHHKNRSYGRIFLDCCRFLIRVLIDVSGEKEGEKKM